MDISNDQLFEALDYLIRPAFEGQKPKNVEQILESNLNSAFQVLQIKDITSFSTFKRIQDNSSSNASLRWRFICTIMHILLSLKNNLNHKFSLPNSSSQTNSSNSPKQPTIPNSTSTSSSTSSFSNDKISKQDILTPTRQKTLKKSLQFVVAIGIFPTLLPSVKINLVSRCSETSARWISWEEKLLDQEKYERLSGITRGLMAIYEHPSLKNLLIQNHLLDLLGALVQLSWVPFKKTKLPTDDPVNSDEFLMTPALLVILEKERAQFKSFLINILSVTYSPLIIRELMFLQGHSIDGKKNQSHPSPKWLQRAWAHMLTQCLCRTNGIESLIRVIMDAAPDTVNQPAKLNIIVQLVTTLPANKAEADNFLKSIARQLFDLIGSKVPVMIRVAVLSIESLLESQREFCTRHILNVLLQPLLRCTVLNNTKPTQSDRIKSSHLPSNNDLAICIQNLHNTWISDKSHTTVLNGQLLRPALFVLFRLACALTDTGSPLKEHVHDLVYKHLQHCTKEELPAVYCALLFHESLPGALEILPNLNFSVNETTGDIILDENSDEVEETLEWLDWSQTTGDCLVSILQRDSRGELVNILFVCLLSKITLDKVNKYSIVGVKLLIELASISHIQESIGANPLPVVKFVHIWLERQANLMTDSQEVEFQEWESLITVLMVLNVIINYSEIESGSSSIDWNAFQVLLDPLQKIQKLVNSEEIRTLTSHVFNALATHGIVINNSLSPADIKPMVSKIINERIKTSEKERKVDVEITKTIDAIAKDEEKEKINENRDFLSVVSPASILELHNAGLNKILESSAAASGKERGEGISAASSAQVIEALVDACSEEIPVRGHGLIALTRLLSKMDSSVKPHIKKILTIMHESIRHSDSYVYLAAIRGMVALSAFEKEQVIKILIEEYTNSISKTNISSSEDIEHRLKIGEILVLLMRMHGETIVKYKNLLLNAFLVGTKDSDPQIRTSSLSDLAEVCKELRYNVGPVINEIIICITSLIRTDPEIEVRRAAIMVFTNLIRGLGKDMLKVLADQLSQIYSTLKYVYQRETDEKFRLHAQLALEEISEYTQQFMFAKPSLEKHIHIRSAPSNDWI